MRGSTYVFGLAQNPRLNKQIEAQMAQSEERDQQTQASARVFTGLLYATEKKWSRQRRVVAKAEHLDKDANPRFLVTSLSAETKPAQELPEKVYCARGEMENRIKEQQLDLFADRTSRSSAAKCGVVFDSGGAEVISSVYLLLETCALVQNRLGLDALRSFRQEIVPLLKLSLVDCVSFAVMRDAGIQKAFALDRHFTEQGFKCI